MGFSHLVVIGRQVESSGVYRAELSRSYFLVRRLEPILSLNVVLFVQGVS